MRTFRRICAYCGSNAGNDPAYAVAARGFGAYLAGRQIGLVYGGGRVGLMGAVADGALEAGGEVIGVIPEKLQALELAHSSLTQLIVVDTMHARKMKMAELSDAFVALPGGWGTLEEIFEVTTWTQLNYHAKPVGLLDVKLYYEPLVGFLDDAVREGFIHPAHRNLLVHATDPAALVDALAHVEIPDLKKWLDEP
jgi:uncharacterized protein (TIGR00730 family)